jgi:hypothetical protein
LYHFACDLQNRFLLALWGLGSNELQDLLDDQRTSSLPRFVSSGSYGYVEVIVASAAENREPPTPHTASLTVAPPVGDHLEPEQMVVLFSDHREVSEMQDETQEAAATSSPDPLTLAGPEDRDIDLYHFLPNSAGSFEAYVQNQQDVSRVLLVIVFPEI